MHRYIKKSKCYLLFAVIMIPMFPVREKFHHRVCYDLILNRSMKLLMIANEFRLPIIMKVHNQYLSKIDKIDIFRILSDKNRYISCL
jgi:hypothetical protein